MGIPKAEGCAHWSPMMVSRRLMGGHFEWWGMTSTQKVVIPAKAGIQYAAAIAMTALPLNTGSSAGACHPAAKAGPGGG
jgi:hypothetical protein